jgi:hypothetical protein
MMIEVIGVSTEDACVKKANCGWLGRGRRCSLCIGHKEALLAREGKDCRRKIGRDAEN